MTGYGIYLCPSKDRSPGRPTCASYLSPYSPSWQTPDSRCPRRDAATDRRLRADYARRPLAKHEHGSPGPSYGYLSQDWSSERSPLLLEHRPRQSRGTVWTDLSRRQPKTPRHAASLLHDYSPRSSWKNDSGSYNQPQWSGDCGDWRTRLAQQGYVASTVKKSRRTCLPEREWHYLEAGEREGDSDPGFDVRTSRGTGHEAEGQHESVISRSRRMRVQKVDAHVERADAHVQVNVQDLDLHRQTEERRANRSFISSRHRSWYDAGSCQKYLSPVPWRGSGVAQSSGSSPEQESTKGWRMAMMGPSEAEEGPAGARGPRAPEDSSCPSEDGSLSETGYESSCTEADRSSGEADGFFTDSLDRSCACDDDCSERSTPFGDETALSLDPLRGGHGAASLAAEDDAQLEEHQPLDSKFFFRFRSLSEGSSQRDSGFSEIYNQCDSPNLASLQEQEQELGVSSDGDRKPYVPAKESPFFGDCRDIDLILRDSDLDPGAFETFEDFERRIERLKSDVRAKRVRSCSEDLASCSRDDFVGSCRDIDEMLGWPTPLSPDSEDTTLRGCLEGCAGPEMEGEGASTAPTSVIESSDIADLSWLADIPEEGATEQWSSASLFSDGLDDCTLQLYRHNGSEGDYGNYLDLESTIHEQAEDFEDFHKNRKNALILRTQLSVRVHAIIEKLLSSSGRELRRALFSLKQIFQDDKDLVHEFVRNDGLACLIKVGSEADQNYQNYILRALGQVMLYVDGMNGVIEHIETVDWLYSLISSKYRLVVKTALKLLLVFVEYSESNSQLLMNTVCDCDADKDTIPWSNIMNLLKEKDSADMELLVYAMTLVNKTLNGIPDQDTYYDIVDYLEEQGMEHVIQYYMSKQGTDLDLLQQFQLYEAVLKHEDGIPDNKPLPLDTRIRQISRTRNFVSDDDRRKSRRHSVGTVNGSSKTITLQSRSLENTPEEKSNPWKDRNENHVDNKKMNGHSNGLHFINGHTNGNNVADLCNGTNSLSSALRRRRERDARNKSLIKEQEQNGKVSRRSDSLSSSSSLLSDSPEHSPLAIEDKLYHSNGSHYHFDKHVNDDNHLNNELSKLKDGSVLNGDLLKFNDNMRPNSLSYGLGHGNKKSWMLSMMYAKNQEEVPKLPREAVNAVEIVNNNYIVYSKPKDDNLTECNLNNHHKDISVRDMQEKFMYRNGDPVLLSPTHDLPRIGDSSGIISRAKEGLAGLKLRPESRPMHTPLSPTSPLVPKPDSDAQWDHLIKSGNRPLVINGLDFTDLKSEEDISLLESCVENNGMTSGAPPKPPSAGPPPPPPPLPLGVGGAPTQPPPMPALCKVNGTSDSSSQFWSKKNGHDQSKEVKGKTKKTVKLFWREVKEDKSLLKRIGWKKTIWDELNHVILDTQKLEHLFENRAKDFSNKEKSQESGKKNELIVLDTKRSNAINIGMTKLPPPRTIKTAILKMDSTIMNREGIEKILTMLPTEDEKSKISEAQIANPDVPLGTAEQFLLMLSSISELEARLRLWAFKLDYETLEREVAEPLMDLKQSIKEIEKSETFRVVLSTLRSVGNFLNGVEIKGFHIEYLSKVPEVKDTVQKHSLLHHLAHIVMDTCPASTDLYSDIGAVTRASKVDYGEVTKTLNKMETECKASWDYLKAILKHDCNITMKVRTTEFLTDCAERIIVLKVIHRRLTNRYHKFLVYLGCTSQSIEELPIQRCCRILSEFALEYRTTRDRVLQQIEKKANHRERNKTRGKLITDMQRFKTKEQQADHELRQLLGSSSVHAEDQKSHKWGTVPGMRGRVRPQMAGGSLGRHSAPVKDDSLNEGEDEILESLVKTATTHPIRSEPRIRKKARYGDRKSLRRTLKGGLEISEEERILLTAITT